jgi:hypothetical protein
VATQTGYPGWENFAEQGGTTLWENWQSTRYPISSIVSCNLNMLTINSEVAYGSRNHIMFGGQSTWYYQALAGITMTPGTIAYTDITIEPLVVYGMVFPE